MKKRVDSDLHDLHEFSLSDRIKLSLITDFFLTPEISKEISRREKIWSISEIVLVLATALVLFLALMGLFNKTEYRVEKESIKNSLSMMIKNGASLELIKHAYNVRELRPTPIKEGDSSLYYSESTPLSIMLNDLCVDYFSADISDRDTLYYSRLTSIIQENQYHNPFDMLEDVQIRYFENLRFRIGDEYGIVQDDVTQIATELHNKNLLVTKYLNKSNSSFIISIAAIILTCLLSCIQLIQGLRTNKIIRLLFKEDVEKKDDKTVDEESKKE